MPAKKKPANRSKTQERVKSRGKTNRVVAKKVARNGVGKVGAKKPKSVARVTPSKPKPQPAVKRGVASKTAMVKAARPNHTSKVTKISGARPASTVSDILGLSQPSGLRNAFASPRVSSKWAKNYKNLLQLRDELLVQSGHLAKDAAEEGANYSMHMADSGTDSFDRDFALSLLSAEQESLFEIEDALRRIENGSYGICELTGKPITKERLAAIPWARYTYEAQRQLEKDGATNRARFGQLGTLQGSDARDTEDSDDSEERPPVPKIQQ